MNDLSNQLLLEKTNNEFYKSGTCWRCARANRVCKYYIVIKRILEKFNFVTETVTWKST